MSQPTLPEPSNNHRPETESTSFVKRGRLWIPETAQRCSLLQKVWHWTGFREKKLWDVLQLLVVPTALAIGAFYLQETAKQRDQQIADDRAKQETLNRYFDQISTLLFERKLRTAKEGDESRIVARAKTLTTLRDLDSRRINQLTNFLREAGLMVKNKPVISLALADLEKTNLSGTDLHEVNLSEANLSEANLFDANLSGANLREANFHKADLSRVNFDGANLTKASFVETVPFGASFIGANLNGAILADANFHGANFRRASLRGVFASGADLSGTNLLEADIDTDFLKSVLLCNTTMRDGNISNRDCDKLKQPK